MNALVSALITTYNRSPQIVSRAINSVINQTYPNIEIVLVNDAPLYEKRYDIDRIATNLKITYIVNETNIGAGASRNKAFQASHGEFVAFLDDDDEWLPNKIEEMLLSFTEDAGLVYCDLIIDSNGQRTINRLPEYKREIQFAKLLESNYVGGYSGPVIRRSAIENVGLMDESLPSQQDSDLWRRISLNYDLIHCKKPLMVYYKSMNSITGNPRRRMEGTLMMLQKYKEHYDIFPKARLKQVKGTIQNFVKSGWYREAKELYFKFFSGFSRVVHIYLFPLGILKRYIGRILER